MFKNIFLKIKRNKVKPGFTIVEIITVLMVISIGITGIMSLIVQNVKSQSINKNTLIAYQLAQEGIELIRQVRDTNWRNNDSWRKDLDAGIYHLDYLSVVPSPANSRSSGRLIKDNNGMYISQPGTILTEGELSRIITISYPNGPDEKMLVNSSVFWIDRGNTLSYVLEAELYDWR